jgi:predicted amidophosphoribosyltransferase
MFCDRCGALISLYDAYCPDCGDDPMEVKIQHGVVAEKVSYVHKNTIFDEDRECLLCYAKLSHYNSSELCNACRTDIVDDMARFGGKIVGN